MNDVVHGSDLTQREKRLLFWASFLALAAAGAGFAFRIAKQGAYGKEFTLTYQEVGSIMGASFWPIAVTMILGSLVVDRTGYKKPMYLAFLLQAGSGVLFFLADGYASLYYASVCAGLGHGIVNSYQSLLFTASTSRNNQFNQGCALNCYARMPFAERAILWTKPNPESERSKKPTSRSTNSS